MESKTYYLKYRPQKVSELDLTEVRENLQKILKSSKIPHALLFSGPKGTGKTSAARIMAKTINCLKKTKEDEPCGKCDICQEITAGSSLDLIEIDAASNRGIDDIRSLREKIKLSPARCRYKVYIIDEVHMLTTEAFNALLKTLEEPPAHAVFILCTTEPQKLPETIISRCLELKFRRSKPEELVHSLEKIVKGEKLILEKGALALIAQRADGSFRDGQKILDQLAAGGGKISLLETQKLLGQIEELKPEKLLHLLADKDLKGCLLEIDRIVNFGADLEIYLQSLLEKLRLMLLKIIGVEISNGQETDLIENLDKTAMIQLINVFTKAASEMKFTPIPQLPLELVAVEWCQDETKIKTPKEAIKIEVNKQESVHNGVEAIVAKWGDLLEGVRPLNHSVEALLRAARPLSVDKDFLTLEVFYKFHKERLDSEKCRVIVEEVASQLLGNPVRLKCVLGEKNSQKQQEESHDIIEVASEIFNGKLVD